MGDDLHERASRTAQVLLAAAEAMPVWVSPDLRVGVDDAAKLIGMKPSGFRKRLPDSGIRVYKVAGQGHKRSVRILDLALWLERESGIGSEITDTSPLPATP